jgi:serine/threonine protein kinase/Tol biopolymer transport system component
MLSPGARIGPYEIVASLGAGGMGEVYRGRDSRLNREVAIKVLPPAVANDPDRLARFDREARVLASLNHPNIAHIHGFEESSTTHALVMELVEGDTLADRLTRGAIAVDQAMQIARQLTDALDAAHERGIVHRDLKPANIKVTPDGTVKVLDFGLAKAQDVGGDDSHSASMTSPVLMSRAGVILGTAAYMSPEQAKGAGVDKRADIWAFGCVFFEMLTGRRVFGGDSMTETLAAVMRDDIHLDRLPATTPPQVTRLIARCLERDPKRRLRDIGEARIALDEAIGRSSELVTPPGLTSASAARSKPSRAAPWIVAAAALGVAAYFAVGARPTATRESLELEIGPPPDAQFLIDSNSGNVLLSPDGTKIVFRAASGGRDALWIRSLARDDARPLTGTQSAQYPFWAPDSRRLAFFAQGKLRTLDTAAGLAQVIADAPNGRGGSWGDDDTLLFAPTGGGTIFRIAASGGTAEVVTRLATERAENAHYWPHILPGGRRFLYFVRSTRPENNGIYVAAIDGSGATRLVSSLSSGIYAPPLDGSPGALMWVQNEELLAQTFDADRAALSGQPAAIASGVRVLESQRGLIASASRTGAVAWASARAASGRFTWFDRDGRRHDVVPVEEGDVRQPSISPDGGRLLYTRVANGTADIFLYDFAARTSRRITPSPDYDEQPLWSPDASEMAYTGSDAGASTLVRVRLDGSVPPTELARESHQFAAVAWSPNRQHLLVTRSVPGSGEDIMLVAADDRKTATPLLTGSANEPWATFSPDGRWIAFNSDRSGRYEIYVVRFRGDQSPPVLAGQPQQITSDGALMLERGWRRDGREIVFQSVDARVMAVPVDTRGETITAGPPVTLFRLPFNQSMVAMTPDADRFVVSEYPFAAGQTIHVLINWRARLAQSR